MDFFGKKSGGLVLFAVSTLFSLVLLWQFTHGASLIDTEEFAPLNEEMERLLAPGGASAAAAATAQAGERGEHAAPSAAAASGAGAAQAAPSPAGLPAGGQTAAADRPALQPPTAPSPTSLPDALASPLPAAQRQALLDINSATLEQLDALPGIGAAKAQAILLYRTQKGRFQRVEELTEVRGIGQKLLAKLKPHVYVAAQR